MPGIHLLKKRDLDGGQPGGRLSDGGGLSLLIRYKGARYWSVQLTIKSATGRGRRVEVGLGRYPDVSLDEARKLAAEARDLARQGIDPRVERTRALLTAPTFEAVCTEAFEARKAQLKGDGEAGRWLTPLRVHVLPKMGTTPVNKVDQNLIRDVLAPIWHDKAATAKKAMDRIGIVLRYGAAKGLEVDLQATDKAKQLLGRSRHKQGHIPSMPWAEVPSFYKRLDDKGAALALRFLILTGVRSANVRFAHSDHIEGNLWTIPAEQMKVSTEDFRVPLSTEALRLIQGRRGLLFPSPRGGVMSDMALAAVMKKMGEDARPHGFRASLRTWLAEATDAPHEVAEMMLAHSSRSTVVDAYRRTDFLEQRKALLDRWAAFVAPEAADQR